MQSDSIEMCGEVGQLSALQDAEIAKSKVAKCQREAVYIFRVYDYVIWTTNKCIECISKLEMIQKQSFEIEPLLKQSGSAHVSACRAKGHDTLPVRTYVWILAY